MTENERMSISGLLDVLNTGISLSTCHIEYVIQSNVLEDLIRCLEELEQYRAIGTIEEFKDLKEKNVAKKVIYVSNKGVKTPHCPNCNMELTMYRYRRKSCNCEQKLDWQ